MKPTINDIAVKITELELGIKQVNVAQVKEILKVINVATGKNFYKWLKESWIR